MKAAIYNGKKNIAIADKPTPVCGPHDVLLKTIYASICGTDVAVCQHGDREPVTGDRSPKTEKTPLFLEQVPSVLQRPSP